jgi:TPR repeat protein
LATRQSSEKALVLALAVERARSQALQQELAKRANATPGGERDAIVRLSAPASDNSAPPAPIERNATPAPVPANKVASTEPPVPPSADNEEMVRLMARAKRLLELGDVGAARSVLERAAEAGSPLATFMLAESYDPTVLSAWGAVGTQGDAAKARELYAKAAAGGVEAAKDRLKTLR